MTPLDHSPAGAGWLHRLWHRGVLLFGHRQMDLVLQYLCARFINLHSSFEEISLCVTFGYGHSDPGGARRFEKRATMFPSAGLSAAFCDCGAGIVLSMLHQFARLVVPVDAAVAPALVTRACRFYSTCVYIGLQPPLLSV